MNRPLVTVLKFGSSVLRSEADLPHVVREIVRERDSGRAVIAVVSAFLGTTDDLIERATSHVGSLEETAFARLLATGEEASAAFLALALSHAGVVTKVLDAGRIGFATSGDLIDGYPTKVDAVELMLALSQLEVAIVPGFVARNTDNEISLLGRGGSDLSAVYIAHAVRALECRLLKDVDGVYTGDPRSGGPVLRYEEATWEDVMRDGPRVVQPKAVRLARRLNRPFTVSTLGSSSATRVGGYHVSRTSSSPATVTGGA